MERSEAQSDLMRAMLAAASTLLLRLLDFGDALTFHADGQLTSGFCLWRVTHQQRLLRVKGKKR